MWVCVCVSVWEGVCVSVSVCVCVSEAECEYKNGVVWLRTTNGVGGLNRMCV